MEKVNRQEEFDLLELFLKAINIIRANFWLIIIFFIVGSVLGLAYYYTSAKVYESKMLVNSSILTKSFSKNLIDRLNRHQRENNAKEIMNLLHVSEKTAKNIAYLNIETVSELDDQKETDKFILTAEVMDQEVLPELQQGIIYYLENNEFVKIRVEQNKNYLKEMIAKVEAEIKDIEIFKQKIISGEFLQSGNIMFDPTTVNSKILELTKEKITLQNNYALVNSVQIIEGFSRFDRPTSPRLSVSLISGSLVGLFFVAVLIAFKSIRRVLRMAEAAQQKQ